MQTEGKLTTDALEQLWMNLCNEWVIEWDAGKTISGLESMGFTMVKALRDRDRRIAELELRLAAAQRALRRIV